MTAESPTRFQEVHGWILPPDDQHFAANPASAPEFLGRRAYRSAQVAAVLDTVTSRRVALDTLDSFGLQDVDLVKIDVEGYESFVVQGARRTLIRSRPIVIVEQKSGSERYGVPRLKAVHQIERLGARVLRRVYDDYILGWPPVSTGR